MVLCLLYRVLGAIVTLRFQIALVIAVFNAIFLLVEINSVLDEPSLTGVLGLLDTPVLLGVSVWLLAQLPPGVVFQRDEHGRPPASATDGESSRPAGGCRVSGQFRIGELREWRLLAPSTLKLGGRGGVEAWAAAPRDFDRSRQLTPFTSARLDWYRPLGLRPPIWSVDPNVMRRLYTARRVREPDAKNLQHLAVPFYALHEVAAGWQYAGVRRYPTLRLTHRGDDRRPQFTYLAFDTLDARDAIWARLR